MEEKLANKIKYNKHPNRQNNDLVAAMYAMYQTGRSLDQVAKVYRKTRQAVYDVFHTRGYELRSKPMRHLTYLDGIGFTEMKGGYLRGTTPYGRITMHKYVWLKNKGGVPQGYVVFHKDRNKKNNDIENLELVKVEDMARKFNPEHKNQFTK